LTQHKPYSNANLELAQAAAGGDAQARREIATRLYDRVRTQVRYLVGSPPSADDFVHMSLLEVLRSLHTYRGYTRLEGWADRIIVRRTLRLLQRERHQANVIALFAEETTHTQPAAGDVGGLRRRMQQLLQRQPIERRAALVLQAVHGYSVAEIAELTETTVNTVRDRLRVARQQLRKDIERDRVLAIKASGEARA
jgi:RNA polymerase sigma-70 factor (ECF subfamily)